MRVSKRWRSTASRVMQPAVEGSAQKRPRNILTIRLASRGSCSVAALWPPDTTQNQVRTLSHLLRDLCEPVPSPCRANAMRRAGFRIFRDAIPCSA